LKPLKKGRFDVMSDREPSRRRNDALQSGEGNPSYGEDARMFGEGGQTTERPLEPGHKDAPDRDPERDQSLAQGEHPDRSKR
jgi:hypothetical protein